MNLQNFGLNVSILDEQDTITRTHIVTSCALLDLQQLRSNRRTYGDSAFSVWALNFGTVFILISAKLSHSVIVFQKQH